MQTLLSFPQFGAHFSDHTLMLLYTQEHAVSHAIITMEKIQVATAQHVTNVHSRYTWITISIQVVLLVLKKSNYCQN